MSGPAPKLVIFDFDGTLVESEAATCRIMSEKLAEEGLKLSAGRIATEFAGKPWAGKMERLELILGRRPRESLIDEVRAAAGEANATALTPTRGALALLGVLTVPFCVASSARRFDMVRKMRAAGLLSLIGPRFFSFDDVGTLKPDPAVFLLAAEIMGYAPAECLVVEDSVSGIEAAKAAGMRFAAFAGGGHHNEEMTAELRSHGPEAVLHDLTELTLLLGR